MEDRVKKYRRQKFIIGLIGALIGFIIYSLLGYQYNRAYNFITGVLSAIIAYAIHDLYHHFKYPKMADTQKVLEKDERNILVKGKSAYITSKITLATLLIIASIGIIIDNQLLAYFSAGLYLYIFMVFNICKLYWDKKL